MHLQSCKSDSHMITSCFFTTLVTHTLSSGCVLCVYYLWLEKHHHHQCSKNKYQEGKKTIGRKYENILYFCVNSDRRGRCWSVLSIKSSLHMFPLTISLFCMSKFSLKSNWDFPLMIWGFTKNYVWIEHYPYTHKQKSLMPSDRSSF